VVTSYGKKSDEAMSGKVIMDNPRCAAPVDGTIKNEVFMKESTNEYKIDKGL